jgi:hypothetical protein
VSQAILVLALLGPPSGEQQEALSAYEHTRQVRLERPAKSAAKTAYLPAYDARLASELEADLDAARTAAASLDEARALELLSRFEKELLAHPELPQSAWLRAERHRLSAELATRGTTPSQARSELRRAQVLEGARASEFGARDTLADAAPANATSLRVEGLDARDRLELDGRAIPGRALSVQAGEHHVRVMRGGRLVFASWVTIGTGASALRLGLPQITPCSAEDFAGYRIDDGRAFAAPGTRCERWVLAAPAGRGLRFADCFADRCGPFVSQPRVAVQSPLPPQPDREKPSRALANAALIGGAVLAGAAVVLWQSGTFDEKEPARTRWVYDGVGTPSE